MIEQLRQSLRALQKPAGIEEAGCLPFGISSIDTALGGGLARGALHEIAAPSEAHLTAATGFALGLASLPSSCPGLPRHDGRGSSLAWVAEDMALAESGAPYGPGLDAFGLPPERLLTVGVAHRRDLLWAMEEALRCRAVAAVIGEWRHGAIDMVAVRRLSLAAAESGALALLLRAAPVRDASTAATRWIVGASPSVSSPSPAREGSDHRRWSGEGSEEITGTKLTPTRTASRFDLPPSGRGEKESAPCFAAHLMRNRRGPTGSWILAWSDSDERFLLATHAQPVAAPVLDRPHRKVA